jgi:hypothetical protein
MMPQNLKFKAGNSFKTKNLTFQDTHPLLHMLLRYFIKFKGRKFCMVGGLMVGIPGLEVYCQLLKSGCILLLILRGLQKQNTDFFPMQALYSMLTARYGNWSAGHWVVFHKSICGVTLLAVCYAWSHSSTTYFLSTYGSINPEKTSYTTHFEDEFGTVAVKHIPQPSIKEWFYDFLPLIDEHNQHRQGLLCLEKKLPTKNCWFCLLTTLVGMCVVNIYRVYLNYD